MSEFKDGYLLNRQEYGCLYPYLMMDRVQQIYWNGRGLWIEEEGQGRHIVTDRPDERFVDRFSMLISNQCQMAFNRTHPVLAWEGENLSIRMVHESLAAHGTTILLEKRKKPVRLSADELTEAGICGPEAIPILKKIVQERQSFLLTGTGGSGMEELMLFLTRYLTPEERVIAVCAEQEIDPAAVNPDKDMTTIRLREDMPPGWLGACLRGMRPDRVLGFGMDGELTGELICLKERYPLPIGIMVYGGSDQDKVAEKLLPEEERAQIRRVQEQLERRFPVWLIMGEHGLERIRQWELTWWENCYEREKSGTKS